MRKSGNYILEHISFIDVDGLFSVLENECKELNGIFELSRLRILELVLILDMLENEFCKTA